MERARAPCRAAPAGCPRGPQTSEPPSRGAAGTDKPRAARWQLFPSPQHCVRGAFFDAPRARTRTPPTLVRSHNALGLSALQAVIPNPERWRRLWRASTEEEGWVSQERAMRRRACTHGWEDGVGESAGEALELLQAVARTVRGAQSAAHPWAHLILPSVSSSHWESSQRTLRSSCFSEDRLVALTMRLSSPSSMYPLPSRSNSSNAKRTLSSRTSPLTLDSPGRSGERVAWHVGRRNSPTHPR